MIIKSINLIKSVMIPNIDPLQEYFITFDSDKISQTLVVLKEYSLIKSIRKHVFYSWIDSDLTKSQPYFQDLSIQSKAQALIIHATTKNDMHQQISNKLADPQNYQVNIICSNLSNLEQIRQRCPHFDQIETIIYFSIRNIQQEEEVYKKYKQNSPLKHKLLFVKDIKKLIQFVNNKHLYPNFLFLQNQTQERNIVKFSLYAMIQQTTQRSQLIQGYYQLMKRNIQHILVTQLQEFIKNERSLRYKPKNPQEIIELYTSAKNCFFYKSLNTILRRSKDPYQLFYVQPFVQDLFNGIKTLYNNQKQPQQFICYRGGLLSLEQIQSFKANQGKIIQNLGFLSTSLVEWKAKTFALNTLLEIKVENVKRNHALDYGYVSISEYSEIPDELQILFNINNSFEIEAVDFSTEDNIYIIRMAYGKIAELQLNQAILSSQKKLLIKQSTFHLQSSSLNKVQGTILPLLKYSTKTCIEYWKLILTNQMNDKHTQFVNFISHAQIFLFAIHYSNIKKQQIDFNYLKQIDDYIEIYYPRNTKQYSLNGSLLIYTKCKYILGEIYKNNQHPMEAQNIEQIIKQIMEKQTLTHLTQTNVDCLQQDQFKKYFLENIKQNLDDQQSLIQFLLSNRQKITQECSSAKTKYLELKDKYKKLQNLKQSLQFQNANANYTMSQKLYNEQQNQMNQMQSSRYYKQFKAKQKIKLAIVQQNPKVSAEILESALQNLDYLSLFMLEINNGYNHLVNKYIKLKDFQKCIHTLERMQKNLQTKILKTKNNQSDSLIFSQRIQIKLLYTVVHITFEDYGQASKSIDEILTKLPKLVKDSDQISLLVPYVLILLNQQPLKIDDTVMQFLKQITLVDQYIREQWQFDLMAKALIKLTDLYQSKPIIRKELQNVFSLLTQMFIDKKQIIQILENIHINFLGYRVKQSDFAPLFKNYILFTLKSWKNQLQQNKNSIEFCQLIINQTQVGEQLLKIDVAPHIQCDDAFIEFQKLRNLAIKYIEERV